MKEIFIGNYGLEQVGQTMTATGWVANIRNHGKLAFIELRDREGLLQVFVGGEIEDFDKLEEIGKEDVIAVTGQVVQREERFVNKAIKSGQVELRAEKIEVIASSKALPFELDQHAHTGEDLRQKYRYLDLRREKMTHNLKLRHQVTSTIREYLNGLDFLEVETPYLTKSTPEGARDFLVPSRVFKNQFYALPQSPQMLKQLLMGAGLERYYQIVRCFRDEDLRGDRQPEFTQVDLELSFASEEEIRALVEAMLKAVVKKTHGLELTEDFPTISYDEAMSRFGSDKPDTRFGLEIQDVTEVFRGTEFKPFAAVLEAGGTIRAINAKGLADKLSRKNIDKLGEVAKTYGAKGLAYSRLTAEGTSSSFEKFLTDTEKAALYAALNAETGDVLLIVSDADWVKACTALGQVRLDIARKHGLIDPDKFNFLWVVDFPLFEYSEQEGRWMAMHHPFTLPKAEDLDKVESDPGACHAVAYDIVLNGVEMGGGSMRINDPALQDRMFHALGFTEEKARASFGFLMDAYKFGAPPHGGMAYGLDRMVMLMLKKDSIRDVIAFPKVQNAGEPMSGAPDVVDAQQLSDLSIALTLKD